MSFVALVYLAGFTVPTALLQDDMAPLKQQLIELIDEMQEASCVSPVDSCRCTHLVKRRYKSRLTQIDVMVIFDVSNASMARLCLRLFFLATGHSVQRLKLRWKELDDSTLQFIVSHTPNLRTVSLVRRPKISLD